MICKVLHVYVCVEKLIGEKYELFIYMCVYNNSSNLSVFLISFFFLDSRTSIFTHFLNIWTPACF